MNVMGLDLSCVKTGVALPDGSVLTIVAPDCANRGAARLRHIRNCVRDLFARVELAVIEGYAFGAINQREALGEVGGVVRLALFESRIPYAVVPAKTLKKYATGNGNASKAMMVAAAQRHLGYRGSDDNEADALWLRAIALDAYDLPLAAMPDREMLKVVKWPKIGVHI